MTKQDILNQREQAQEDICCILDGMDESVIDQVCDVIVERFNILIDKL